MAKKEFTADAPRPLGAAQSPLPKQMMYIGPTLAEDKNIFSHGDIFSNGLPDHYMTKILLEPDFKHLIVPVAKVALALAELRDESSHRSQLSRRFFEASRKRTSGQEGAK